jgi:hypothetical protein
MSTAARSTRNGVAGALNSLPLSAAKLAWRDLLLARPCRECQLGHHGIANQSNGIFKLPKLHITN